MIKYKTGRWKNEIEEVKIIKETAKQVTYAYNDWNGSPCERREAKESNYHQYHDSWEDAHEHLLNKAHSRIESLRSQLQRAQGEYGNLKGMKKGVV